MGKQGVSVARRRFLRAAGLLASMASLRAWPAQTAVGQSGMATLTLRSGAGGRKVSEQLVGLSYETLQMHNPQFFAPGNDALIGLLRTLNPHGILRLGGNTSDFSVWSEYHGPLPSFQQLPHAVFPRPYTITPDQLANLAGFLRTTGWRLIFGVNLRSDVPEMAAELAEAVQRAAGDSLFAIQIGNEANDYHRDAQHFIDYDRYFDRWQRTAHAIRKRVAVPIAGPDTGANTDWVLRFADQVPDAVALSRHYYRGGAPEPTSTVQELLGGDPGFLTEVAQIARAADRHRIPFILSEANSFWGGGKLGISNTFAAALWGGDFVLACAQAGMSSINIHAGVLSILETSLDKSVAPAPIGSSLEDRLDAISGRYSPIAGDVGQGFYARPLYYGLLLAQQFAGGEFMPTTLQADGINLTAYAAVKNGQRMLAVFNKDMARNARVRVKLEAPASSARVWRMQAPALDDVHHCTLTGAQVSGEGKWSPRDQERVALSHDTFELKMPRTSAALVWLDG